MLACCGLCAHDLLSGERHRLLLLAIISRTTVKCWGTVACAVLPDLDMVGRILRKGRPEDGLPSRFGHQRFGLDRSVNIMSTIVTSGLHASPCIRYIYWIDERAINASCAVQH